MRLIIDFGPEAARAVHRMAAEMRRAPAEAVHDLVLAAAILKPGETVIDEERVLKQPLPVKIPRSGGNQVSDDQFLEWGYTALRQMHADGLTDREMAARFRVTNHRVAAARRRLGLPANKDTR